MFDFLCYTSSMEKKFDDVQKRMSKRLIVWNNFIGGFSWGIGSALGAALLVFILGFILAKINIVPFVGHFVAQVEQVVQQKNASTPTPTR